MDWRKIDSIKSTRNNIMSRIFFHSLKGTAAIRGSERAYMKMYLQDNFYSVLNTPFSSSELYPFFYLIPEDCYIKKEVHESGINWFRFLEMLRLWISSTIDDNYFIVGDYKLDIFTAQLNTALITGSNPIKLMVRLHGQCEIHCYIEGENREWLAQIIEKGLNLQIYRDNKGWESVVDLLRDDCNSPVVTSYSVCEQFPTEKQEWELAMSDLKRSSRSLELDPKYWEDYYFGSGWDVFKINRLLEIPKEKWGEIARVYEESLLPPSDAWLATLRGI